MFLEKESSMNKEAANRRFREYMKDKAQEWFPDLVEKIPAPVLAELLDNYAAGILEVTDPGKNKIINKDQFIHHVDKTTGDKDPYLESKMLTLVQGFLSKTKRKEEAEAEAKRIVPAFLSKGRSVAPKGVQLVDDKGHAKASFLEHLVYKTLVERVPDIAKDFSKEFAQYISTIPADSSYISDLVKLFNGDIVTDNTMLYEQYLENFFATDTIKNTLKDTLSNSWYGPVDIPVDITKLDHTLTTRQATTLVERLHSIDHSTIYKDKERLQGSMGRLPPWPGPRQPWNKGSEILLMRNPNTANFEIREGLHRFMAMMIQTKEANQTKFTVSAYVYDRGTIGKFKKVFMDAARSFFLSLPSSGKGSWFSTPQSLQSR
jgi:hypothetical protein